MPIHRCSIDGRSGWKWGESGKCYVGSRGRSKALRQARAIRASGWVENVARRHARASRIDPSRTTMLREKFRRELVGRYDRVRRAVLQVVGRENLFRIVENREYVPGPKYPFTTDPERVEAFTAWLKERMDVEVLPTDDAYWERYAAEGFQRGAGRAFDDVNRLKRATAFGGNEPMAHYLGTKEQFLQSSFGQPETIDKLKILAGRVYTDLKGVNETVATQLNRVLVDGLARGENPRTIAREMAKGIDGIGKRRAETIARTEIIRAHAEGQLDAMERLGVDEVGVMAEWSTAGDDRVCDLCWPLEGKVLPIGEAHSLIPLHPNCRCTWIPSVSASVKKVPEKKQVEPETVQKIEPTIETSKKPEPVFSVPVEMSAQDAKQWVATNISTRKLDAAINEYLPVKTKQLLGDARASVDETLKIPGAGITRHGENGPIINWHEGDVHVGLHEIGHAIQYPGRRDGTKFVTSAVNPLDTKGITEKAIAEYKLLAKAGTDDFRGVLYLDASSQNEMWADIVGTYLNPRRTLLMREAMPETWNILREVLGELPYKLPEVSPRLKSILKTVAAEGHLRRRQWESYGLNSETYDQLADLTIPRLQPWITGGRKYAKNEGINLVKKFKAAETLLE